MSQCLRRGSGWDDERTDALLEIWNDHCTNEIDDASASDTVVYRNISNLMKEGGFELSDTHCKTKKQNENPEKNLNWTLITDASLMFRSR